MSHSIDFFRDEVRNGFYIPTAIKQAWAAELDVLAEIDRVCCMHGIRYFADWGTFLGAVRHGGFVPWDDDLDICMLRDDYEKFRSVADEALPASYTIHDYESHDNHRVFLIRVVNNERMCFDEEYLNSHDNFPWLAGVDIFIKDYLYADDEREEKRDKEVKSILAVADGILDKTLNKQSAAAHINEIRKRYMIKLPAKYKEHDIAIALYRLAEREMSKVGADETDRVGQIFPWVLKYGSDAAERKSLYEKSIRLPFEDTTIPVPAAYNEVLTKRYGNYNELRKVWDGHDYPFFEGQKAEMEKLSGQAFFGFTFDKSMLIRQAADKSGSLKTIAEECLSELKRLLSDAEESLSKGDMNEFTNAIADSQQLAADLGTLTEQTKGEEAECTKRVVEALQEYCDAMWEEYQEISNGERLKELHLSRTALDNLYSFVKDNILSRKEILFLPIGVKEWKGMEEAYKASLSDDTDTFVVPLPLMKKTFLGKITMSEEEINKQISGYPRDIPVFYYKDYDLRLHCPDIIYVQFPYDGENPCLTIPDDYYVKGLRRYTDKIIYIPCFKTAEFSSEDVNDVYNMKHYVTAPAVVYADEVIVQSENIKERYIEALTAFAGEETKSVWREKIRVLSNGTEAVREKASDITKSEETDNAKLHRKTILYCIGANELTEHKDIFAASLSDKLKVFSDAADDMDVDVTFYPNDEDLWKEIDTGLSERIFDEVYAFTEKQHKGRLLIKPIGCEDTKGYDAYYGSPSPLVPSFITQRKPVMIADYGLYEPKTNAG